MKRISIFLTLVMVLAMIATPSLAATEDMTSESTDYLETISLDTKEKSYTFSSDVSKQSTLKEMYGTDVSKGEYIEAVFPEALEVLPKETVARFYETPMIWPEETSVTKDGVTSFTEPTEYAATASGVTYLLNYVSDIEQKTSSSLTYSSKTTVKYPVGASIPEIDVFSYLWKNGDTSPMDSSFKISFFTDEVEVSTDYSVLYGTYFTKGTHHNVMPLDGFPLYWNQLTISDTITMSNIG
ncbi:hypothetical protein HNV12_14760 [Methanococcoides sp. SA1]|nr:hypothetical protein [Methanococcoides sp. SA1]